MKKSNAAFLSILTATALTVPPLFASCSVKASGGSGVTSAVLRSDTESVAAAAEYIPAKADYGGYKFRIAENKNGQWVETAFMEQMNGESLNDAVYERNKLVENLLNIDISGTVIEGNRNGQNLASLTASILAGDDTFDIAYIPGQLLPVLLGGGSYLTDLRGIKTLDLENPWWESSSVDAMSIKNRTYAITGDLTIPALAATTMIMFNKTLVGNLKLENPYTLVKNGNWTTEKFYGIAKGAVSDVNGDGKIQPADDTLGMCLEEINLPQFVLAGGGNLTVMNKDGIPELALNNEKNADIVEQFIAMINDYDTVFFAGDKRGVNSSYDQFSQGRLLFFVSHLQATYKLRQFDLNFGAVPYPKYSESQEHYNVPLNEYWSSWLTVPVTAGDAERTGNIVEALGYYAKKITTPAFIDTSITGKSLRDEESVEMLDLALENRVFDMGCYYDWGYAMLSKLARNRDGNFESAYASNESIINESIKSVVKAIIG